MSRVVRFYSLGGPDVLRLEEREAPQPAAGEVLIEVKAIGLNRADVMFRTGRYLEKATFPSQIGFEASGTVIATGADVENVRAGDAVGVLPGFDISQYGTYADHAIIPQAYVLAQPKGLTDIQAAGLWMAYLTAYGGLIEAGGVNAGDWVVISAASSSVGLAAIQIAKQAGARPIAITLTGFKRNTLMEMGAWAVIASQEESLERRLLELTGGMVNCAFDAVAGPQLTDLAQAMAPKGTVVVHGALSPDTTTFPLKLALKKSLTFRGYVYTEVTRNPQYLARAQHFISRGIASGVVQPYIDRTFTLDEVIDAHRYLESNQQFGKIVLTT